jgi:hypothetical protein
MPSPSKSELPESEEWISVRHSKVDQPDGVPPRRVTREAFNEVWSDLGWVEIPKTASADPSPVLVDASGAAPKPGGS